MTYFYYRKNGEVVMTTSKKMKTPFLCIKKTPNKAEREKLKKNWKLRVKKGKLNLEKPQWEKDEEKLTPDKIKEMVDNSNNIDELKEIIKLLIK